MPTSDTTTTHSPHLCRQDPSSPCGTFEVLSVCLDSESLCDSQIADTYSGQMTTLALDHPEGTMDVFEYSEVIWKSALGGLDVFLEMPRAEDSAVGIAPRNAGEGAETGQVRGGHVEMPTTPDKKARPGTQGTTSTMESTPLPPEP